MQKVPFLLGGFEEGFDDDGARVVEQDIHRPPGRLDRGDGGADFIRFGNIRHRKHSLPARRLDLSDHGGGSLFIAVNNRHPRALGGEQLRSRPAHPGGAAGDDGGFALKSISHRSMLPSSLSSRPLNSGPRICACIF